MEYDMIAKGSNGILYLIGDRIRISRKGLGSFLLQGLKGDKDININDISAVQLKKSGVLVKGYIQFTFNGSAETKKGIFDATKDENSILFTNTKDFEKIRDEIQKRMTQLKSHSSPTYQPSIPEQIKQISELKEQGIISEEEFEKKKKELLDKM